MPSVVVAMGVEPESQRVVENTEEVETCIWYLFAVSPALGSL